MKLNIWSWIEDPIELSGLINLEELCVFNGTKITDWTDLPLTLTKLEQIQILQASMAEILPFISNSKNLEKIHIMNFYSADGYQEFVINLAALNKEREKLDGACKTTIYVREIYYLYTKWAQKDTDLSLIRLKRIESFEFDDHFYDTVNFGFWHI